MNERIKQLALQAEFYSFTDGELQSPFREEEDISGLLEKFAELIVRECSSICRGVGDAVWAEQHQSNIGTARTCDAAILLYFGVEE